MRSPVSHDGQAPATPADQPTGWLLVSGAALSIDNLAVGFALGAFHVSLALAAIVIGVISISMSLSGLELAAGSAPAPASAVNSSAAWS